MGCPEFEIREAGLNLKLTTGTIRIVLATAICATAGCGPRPEVPPPEPPEAEQVISPEERLGLAAALMEQGRVGEAADHYREVLNQAPGDFEANLNLGISLWTMEEAGFKNERDYAEAETYFVKAAEADGADPRPHLYLGKIEFEREAYGAAIDHLSVAAGLDPASESAHEMLGLALIEIGREEAATRELRETLEINPKNQAANLALGKIYEARDMNGLAVDHLERALEANPNLDVATYILERAYYEEGEYRKAEAKCKHFLRYHPGDIQSLEILGWTYELQGRTAEKLEIYDMLTQAMPENTSYWSPLIQHHMEAGEYTKAGEILERALEYNPYYAYGNVRYGQVLMHYGEQSLQGGNRVEARRLFSLARDHLRKAKIDDRYTGAATQLISQVENRLQELGGSSRE
jgi:tetratricopeptide (TPR) repeat protein